MKTGDVSKICQEDFSAEGRTCEASPRLVGGHLYCTDAAPASRRSKETADIGKSGVASDGPKAIQATISNLVARNSRQYTLLFVFFVTYSFLSIATKQCLGKQ
jgi:hypothetical protein